MIIHPIPIFNDNYVWAIIDTKHQTAVVVDPGSAADVIQFLQQRTLDLKGILITHHHWDHTNGLTELKNHYPAIVFGPAKERIPGIMQAVQEGDVITIDDFTLDFNVLNIPGHTLGHIAYFANDILFCGDTLFAGGCGKLFEGTAAQLFASLMKLLILPEATKIYCGHEYTLTNLRFAETIEPSNKKITERIANVIRLRNKNTPSLPSTLLEEKATNPFLRCHSNEIIQNMEKYIGHALTNPVQVFAALRLCKDEFKA